MLFIKLSILWWLLFLLVLVIRNIDNTFMFFQTPSCGNQATLALNEKFLEFSVGDSGPHLRIKPPKQLRICRTTGGGGTTSSRCRRIHDFRYSNVCCVCCKLESQ